VIYWLFLALAIALEVIGTSCLKFSTGFTKVIPSTLVFLFYGLSFTALGLALKKIDVSIAYAIWAGVGTIFIALIGFTFFKETITFTKLMYLLLIIIGVIGLKLSSSSP
jgi:small multidrug resistance pump